MKLKFKKGNTVKIFSGDERGKTWRDYRNYLKTDTEQLSKGLNIVKKHLKPTKEKKGGIISVEQSIHLSNF